MKYFLVFVLMSTVSVLPGFASSTDRMITYKSHCHSGSVVYFNCRLKNSRVVVSLCGSNKSLKSKSSIVLSYFSGVLGGSVFKYPGNEENQAPGTFFGESFQAHGENLNEYSVGFEYGGSMSGIVVRTGENNFSGSFAANIKYSEKSCESSTVVDHLPWVTPLLEKFPGN